MSSGAPARRRRWWALGFVLVGNVVVINAVTTMNVALPAAQDALGLSDPGRQWVATLYSLFFGAFMLLGGRIGDVLGLRRCLLAGLVGFSLASLLGGLAPDTTTLLAARALQGLAGALVAATALAMLSVMFPGGPDRARAFTLFGVAMGVGAAASFVLAGALIDAVSWRWVMLVNVPLALVVAAGLDRTAPHVPVGPRARIGIGSAAMITAAMGLLVVGFDRAGADGWNRPAIWGLLTSAAVLLGLFALTLRRSRAPLIPPYLLADRRRLAVFAAAFVVGIGQFAGMFILTTSLQEMLGYSAIRIGVAFVPFGLSTVVTSRLLPILTPRLGTSMILALGLLFVASALVTFVRLEPGSSYATGVLPAMILLGAGGTFVMVTASDAATFGVGADSGVASAVVNSSQQIGAALGTALLTSIMSASTRRHAADVAAPELDAVLVGYSDASIVGAGILVAGALAVFLLRRRPVPSAELG